MSVTGAEQPEDMVSSGQQSLPSLVHYYRAGLPTLSSSLFKLNQILSITPIDLRAVDELVQSDPCLAAHLMQLGQAAGIAEERLCILHECIVLLGVSAIRNLVFTSAIAPTDAATSLRLRALCQHSQLAAILTRRIALLCGHPEPDVAQAAALLHDIGKIPFIVSLPPADFARVSAEVSNSHSMVGARLSKQWKLPALVSDVIEYHHYVADARRDPSLVRMVAAADRLCHSHGVGLHAAPANTFKHTDYAAVFAEYLPRLRGEQEARLAELLESDFLGWLAMVRNA